MTTRSSAFIIQNTTLELSYHATLESTSYKGSVAHSTIRTKETYYNSIKSEKSSYAERERERLNF